MGKEREIAIIDVNRKEVIKRLKELKAKHVGKHRFKRIEFLLKGEVSGAHSWARVRTDGKKTVITLKELLGKGGFTHMNEYEVNVDKFSEAVKIMSKLTDSKIFYFENERDAYKLGDAYITIDKWPQIPHFVEIESPSIKNLKKTYKMLKIKGRFLGNVPIQKIYEIYHLDFRAVVDKNKDKLARIIANQK